MIGLALHCCSELLFDLIIFCFIFLYLLFLPTTYLDKPKRFSINIINNK